MDGDSELFASVLFSPVGDSTSKFLPGLFSAAVMSDHFLRFGDVAKDDVLVMGDGLIITMAAGHGRDWSSEVQGQWGQEPDVDMDMLGVSFRRIFVEFLSEYDILGFGEFILNMKESLSPGLNFGKSKEPTLMSGEWHAVRYVQKDVMRLLCQ